MKDKFDLEKEILKASDRWEFYSQEENYDLALANYYEGKFDALTQCRQLKGKD